MMKLIKFGTLCLAAVGMLSLSQIPAKAEYSAEEKKQIEELKKSYPLTTCPVSGDELKPGPMGDPVDYLYKQKTADGKEITRLVRFCCKDCVKKFTKNPEKYLKMIDEAAAKKASATEAPATAPSTDGEKMKGHDHSKHGM